MSASVETWSGKDRADENFPVGSFLIRRRLRRHIHAFYAFARNADDIADSPTLLEADKLARLDTMEAVLLGTADPALAPSAATLAASLRETGVTDRHARDLLIAFRRDATKHRYATWEELHDYCRYSAMPVGRHVLDLHGETRNTWGASDALCVSLQVLNHLQDCAKDLAALDRCYLPEFLLESHGARVADLRARRTSPQLRAVFAALLAMCAQLNHHADSLPLRTRSWGLKLETGMIVGLAKRLTRRLKRGDPLRRRVKLRPTDLLIAGLLVPRYLRIHR